ncbi:hypothetical protein OKW41_005737 [Paraburkholderia sp. UCT70]
MIRADVSSIRFDRTATNSPGRSEAAARRNGGIMGTSSHVRAARRGSFQIMISSLSSSLLHRAAVVVLVFGALAACQKNDASAGQVAGKLNDAAQLAGQKLDQAASYVGQQVDATKDAAQQNLDSASAPSLKIDPAALASSAQANVQNAASAANAQLGKAASITGQGLETAGRKLQAWSAQNAGASASSTASTDSADAQKQMDK